jgi:hypothetical protein
MPEPDLVPLDESPAIMAGVFGAEAPRSPHWEKVRHDYAVLHPTCAACGGAKMIQIHHCKPFHLHPELELDPSNFITLCENPERLCHHRIGHAWDWHAYVETVREDAAESLARVEGRLYE